MTTHFLSRPEGRIGYQVTGDGPLVVCLPGMGDVRSIYRFLAADLAAAGYRVAAMDLRGHGDSDDGFDRFDDVAAGQDALALLAELGGPGVLVGNSMSAGGAVWAAAERPDLVRGLVLTGPYVRDPQTAAPVRWAMRALLVRPWGPAAFAAWYRRLYPGSPPADLPEHVVAIRASLRRPGHWRSFVRTSRTSHEPARLRLPEVTAPTLVVMGDRDPDWKDPAAEARFVADALGGELLLVPGAGHYPMAERPDLVGPAVRSFLDRLDA